MTTARFVAPLQSCVDISRQGGRRLLTMTSPRRRLDAIIWGGGNVGRAAHSRDFVIADLFSFFRVCYLSLFYECGRARRRLHWRTLYCAR